jgi:hypothetical protein
MHVLVPMLLTPSAAAVVPCDATPVSIWCHSTVVAPCCSPVGLVAQQQCVGPLQLPISDVAVYAQSHQNHTGLATSIGEQPIKVRRGVHVHQWSNLCQLSIPCDHCYLAYQVLTEAAFGSQLSAHINRDSSKLHLCDHQPLILTVCYLLTSPPGPDQPVCHGPPGPG